ncbi:hypothetical protein N9S24_01725 [SAR86 cluster bacterium]|nr:hypothetical protein [SAR86 cluster bacterium]
MKIFLDTHGIKAELESNNEGFIDLVSGNYKSFISEDLDEVNLRINFSLDAGEFAKEKKEGLPRIAEGLYQDKNTIYWENEFGFVIHVELIDFNNWNIHGYHFNLELANTSEDQLKNYTRSMRWMIHFPLFSLLKKVKAMRLVHASTISKNSNALIFAGLNKVGKSSLSRYLFEKYEYQYMSDNFLLTDGNMVYGFPEKNRLTPDSLEILNISPKSNNKIYGKFHMPFEESRVELVAKPQCVFIVNNSNTLEIESISRESALNSLEGMHSYLQEFPEYTFYSMLNSFDSWREEDCNLFPEDAKFYKIYLPLNWSLSSAAKKVLECI